MSISIIKTDHPHIYSLSAFKKLLDDANMGLEIVAVPTPSDVGELLVIFGTHKEDCVLLGILPSPNVLSALGLDLNVALQQTEDTVMYSSSGHTLTGKVDAVMHDIIIQNRLATVLTTVGAKEAAQTTANGTAEVDAEQVESNVHPLPCARQYH